tara:strand:+ start:8243 stop:8746 length:504 start_codon:yes stop_codon:yes gene_type:complete
MDFSFMKAGTSNVATNENNTNDLLNMLELFTANSLETSGRFVELCNRNAITETDIKYGLIYEVFEFFNRPNNLQDLNEIEQQNKDSHSEDDEEEYDEEEDMMDETPDFLMDDSEVIPFSRIELESLVNPEDQQFVTKLYNYFDNWETWVPQTPIEHILQNAINKITL